LSIHAQLGDDAVHTTPLLAFPACFGTTKVFCR